MQELLKVTDSLISQIAKNDINVFLEYVLKDNNGKRIIQGEIHKEIQWHIEECKRTGNNYCGVLAPWGHGKTESSIIGRTLHTIGNDKNKTVFIISNTDENAKARIDSISNYILNDKDYKKVFPDIKPSINQESWSKHKITVERDSMSKDGTVEAYGIMTSGVGGRCDVLMFDDVVDMRNAITNPAMREQVKANIDNVWLSRLRPDGMAIYVATLWHNADATSFMMKNNAWKFIIIKVSEDLSCLECESPFKGKYTIPLWEYWNKQNLLKKQASIGKRAFNRGFRQIALSDEDRTFPNSEMIFNMGLDKSIIQRDWPRVIGIDPFGQWVVLFVIAINPINRMRFVVDIVRGKFKPSETVEQILTLNNQHRPQIIVCENNASQEAIIQWASEKGHADLPIVPFTTGKQKADIAFGLPSIDVEFSNGAWCVPCKDINLSDNENTINIWRNELLNHPIGETADTVMAMWFAREGARVLFNLPEDDGKVISESDAGVEQVSIGNY